MSSEERAERDVREVREVLARYVRATDRRDGKGQGALFTDDAVVQIYARTGTAGHEPVGEPLIGGAAVAYAVEHYMAPHPEGGAGHHMTADHLVEVDGDHAHMNAQFVVFRTRAAARPAEGWPAGAFGAQGTVEPVESGYYDTDLRRVDGVWKIVHHRVLMDMPIALPGGVMRAVVYRRYGGPEVLELAELPTPRTHVDSVLVRVRAAALNPADLALQAGALHSAVDTYFPVVPGWDIAGVVEHAGPAAPEFAPGDEVIGYIRGDVQRAHGALAELVAADVRTLVHKPAGMGFAEAAGLPLAGLTAHRAVVRALDVRPGQTLLVHGAGGGVGSLAVQLALARGARVIGTASPADQDHLRALGAEPVAYGQGAAARVRELAPRGADAVLDTAGGGTLAATADAARTGARVASVAETGLPGVVPVFCRLDRADLAALVVLAEAGKLSVRVAATHPLERAADAQRQLAAGGSRGKVVVDVT